MGKDPAVLFYTSDFLTGTSFFTMEQRGQYITLLCEQHQNGHIPENHMISICLSYDSPVIKKFIKDENGNFYNERMEQEKEKRSSYCKSRSNNKSGRKKKIIRKSYDKSYENHMLQHMENENENRNRIRKKKIEIQYPYTSTEFIVAWESWKEYKRNEYGFKFKSPVSEQTALNKLSDLSETDAINAIEYSIACGYRGIFPEKKNGKKYGPQSPTVESLSNQMQRFLESED